MIRLTRRVSIVSFDVAATVAVGRDRPEFLAVARLAADLGRAVTPRDIEQELLGDMGGLVGALVIQRCCDLGLLEWTRPGDRTAGITEAGRTALEHGEVLVTEEGAWRFWMVVDPLVSGSLLHAERLRSSTARAEVRGAKEARQRGERLPGGLRTPDPIIGSREAQPFESVLGGPLLRVHTTSELGTPGPQADGRLELVWAESPVLRLTGDLFCESTLERRSFERVLPYPPALDRWSYGAVWRHLVAAGLSVDAQVLLDWQSRRGGLIAPVTLAAIFRDDERRRFVANLQVPPSTFEGLGSFEESTLPEIDLVPATRSDAEEWLRWLQWDDIDDYMTRSLLDAQREKLATRFPDYPGLCGLGPEQLLERARRDESLRRRYLMASVDLGIWS